MPSLPPARQKTRNSGARISVLYLRVEFLTGQYVATAFNDRWRGEWPPHPSRLFSALAATHFEGGADSLTGQALRWLEAQPAPALTCSKANARDVKPHFVPVNDGAISDTRVVARAWEALLDAGEAAGTKESMRLSDAYAKAAALKSSTGKGDAAHGRHLLPSTRTRQLRAFPCVVPEDPVVHFRWSGFPEPGVRQGLELLASNLVRLGHSSSLVAAAWSEDGPEPTLLPRDDGDQQLRWVSQGQLDTLEGMHGAAPYGEQRLMPYLPVRYGPKQVSPTAHRSGFADEFPVLRRVDGPRLPIGAAEVVASAVRQALMCHADAPVPGVLSGHEADGSPLAGNHLAVVPLPFVGGRHASGDLLGVALVPPRELDLEALTPIYRALGNWESGSYPPRVELRLGKLGLWTLAREIDESSLRNLRPRTWTRPATRFTSATPMVLDRHPGSIRSGSDRTVRRVEESIRGACARIGIPAPATMEFGQAPYLAGAGHVRTFMRRIQRPDPRPLVHVRLTFEEPVQGPILLGAGRYRGLGLFRPEASRHE